MKKLLAFTAVALMASTGVATSSLAQSATAMATATADLNVRSGPGPQYPAIGFIAVGDAATVEGCLDASKWCRVSYGDVNGWAYSDYLTADLSGETLVLTDRYSEVGLTTVTYEDDGSAGAGAVGGGVTGAVVGALLGGPVGAVIGGAVGASGGAAAGAIIDPPETVTAYVSSNPIEPVYLEGEVVIGAGVPETVALQVIPDYEYQYVYINGQAVLVDPASRQIVYVVR